MIRATPSLIASILVAMVLASVSARAEPPRELRFEDRTIDLAGRVVDLTFATEDTVSVVETSKDVRIELPSDVLFDFDKASIREQARGVLMAAAAILRAHPGAMIRFNGHADSKGTEAHNLPLSLKRAKAVQSWLAGQAGVPAANSTTAGYGARQPAVPNVKPDGTDDPDGRQRNRRVEIVISK